MPHLRLEIVLNLERVVKGGCQCVLDRKPCSKAVREEEQIQGRTLKDSTNPLLFSYHGKLKRCTPCHSPAAGDVAQLTFSLFYDIIIICIPFLINLVVYNKVQKY